MALLRRGQLWGTLSTVVVLLFLAKLIIPDDNVPWWAVFAPLWMPAVMAFVLGAILNILGKNDAAPKV